MHYDLSTLANGLRIITQDMPSVHSAAIGMWVDTGSRDESPIEAGTSHFLEHLLFKGSEAMSAHYISDAFDSIGARHNAFTSKEHTCYWAKVRDADIPLAVKILTEMLRQPAFRQEEIDSERHVVLEEINMNEDDPTDVAYELFITALWEGHPLALPILGTKESIGEMTRDTIADYWRRRYSPNSVVVAAGGRVDHDDFVNWISEAMEDWRGDVGERLPITPKSVPRVSVRKRDTEQAHVVFGMPALARSDDRRWALQIADHVLGGGMSSRLFREIREQRGLAYAVSSFRLPFSDAGAAAIYVGTSPHQTSEVLGLVRSELDKLMAEGLSEEELERSKGNVKGSMALLMEDSSSWMTRLGRSELTGEEHLSVDEIVDRISTVTNDEVIDVAREVYSGPYVIGAVGPFAGEDLEEFVR